MHRPSSIAIGAPVLRIVPSLNLNLIILWVVGGSHKLQKGFSRKNSSLGWMFKVLLPLCLPHLVDRVNRRLNSFWLHPLWWAHPQEVFRTRALRQSDPGLGPVNHHVAKSMHCQGEILQQEPVKKEKLQAGPASSTRQGRVPKALPRVNRYTGWIKSHTAANQ